MKQVNDFHSGILDKGEQAEQSKVREDNIIEVMEGERQSMNQNFRDGTEVNGQDFTILCRENQFEAGVDKLLNKEQGAFHGEQQ